jgi:uncharacterized phage protein (TIGR01671 family)
MKREIKFRVWDKKEKKMFQVETLYLYMLTTEKRPLIQYTGLKDKKRKEIYEGDIVAYGISRIVGQNRRKIPGTVVWEDAGAYFRIKSPANDTGLVFNAYPDELWCEVIGNIYENPEFLPKTIEG